MGGFGTRLKSISGDIPKPMMSVGGQPFVYRLMRQLDSAGCSRIVLALHYRAEYVIDRVLRDSPVQCDVRFVVEDSPLGTGGALKLSATEITTERFVVMNGDSICDLDLNELLTLNQNADCVVCAVTVDDCTRYGALDFDTDRSLRSINEKGRSGPGTINGGVYLVSKSAILSIQSKIFSFETEFLTDEEKDIKIHLCGREFIDIGIPEDYHKACEIFS